MNVTLSIVFLLFITIYRGMESNNLKQIYYSSLLYSSVWMETFLYYNFGENNATKSFRSYSFRFLTRLSTIKSTTQKFVGQIKGDHFTSFFVLLLSCSSLPILRFSITVWRYFIHHSPLIHLFTHLFFLSFFLCLIVTNVLL